MLMITSMCLKQKLFISHYIGMTLIFNDTNTKILGYIRLVFVNLHWDFSAKMSIIIAYVDYDFYFFF